ncbi:MAG: BTAD domain-containing putative transcriptional regulator [Caldilineaceae bacterium]
MAATLQITLFGSPQIFWKEKRLTGFITSKAEALFYYLVVTRRAHTRTALAGLLWPEVSDSQAKKNLRDILPNLRLLLDPYLLITRGQVAFNEQSSHWVDIAEFHSRLSSSQTEDATTLQQALSLYQGDFLDGFYVRDAPEFETWVRTQREQLRTQCIQGLHTLVVFYLANKMYNEGLTFTNRLLTLEPWDEQAHRQQMLLLALNGQRSAALAQYATCRRILAEDLDVEPSAQTTALYERIRAEEISTLAPTRPALHLGVSKPALPLAPHNLPRALTAMIDRADDVGYVQEKLLDSAYPLITLTGEGGIGKTRLALALAERVLGQFADGVWFVPLASLSPMPNMAEQLADTIGAALKLTFTGTTTLQAQLFQHLQTKALLLILDNFEWLTGGAEFILDLLQATQSVKILVTSRQRLNLYGEYVYRLKGLLTPTPEVMPRVETLDLLTYPAVQLFVERAERTMSDFHLTPANQVDVVRICRFVEGLPLGIELAAALLEHHDCATIAARLESDYAILTTDLVGMPARHRSIQAVLTYSWQFLTPAEAALLAYCSVFRSGFTAEAAAAIAGASPVQLQRLVDQSLLRQPEHGGFEMHELVRRYASEQLHADPQRELQAHQRHSEYFIQWLQTRQTHPTAHALQEQGLVQALNNLREVWHWAVTHQQWTLIEQSLVGLFELYHTAGYYQEATSVLTDTLAHLRQQIQSQIGRSNLLKRTLAKLLLQKADLEFRLGHINKAEQLVREALHLGKQFALTDVQAEAYWHLGWIEFRRAHWIIATGKAEKSLQLARRSDYTLLEAQSLNLLGICWSYRHEHDQARLHLLHALALAQELQHHTLQSTILINLGEHLAMFGEYAQALRYFQQARISATTHQYRENIGVAAYNLANLFQIMGDWATAEQHFAEALTCLTQIGETYYASLVHIYWGNLHCQHGDYETAIRYYQQAQQQCRSDGYHDIEQRAWNHLGKALLGLHRFGEAEAAYQQALSLTTYKRGLTDRWLAQVGLAQLYLDQQQPQQAAGQLEGLAAFLVSLSLHDPYEPPFNLLWTCYRVLSANHDPHGQVILQRGHHLLMEQALAIDNPALRRSFLENVPVHRAIVEAIKTVNPTEKRCGRAEHRQQWLCHG